MSEEFDVLTCDFCGNRGLLLAYCGGVVSRYRFYRLVAGNTPWERATACDQCYKGHAKYKGKDVKIIELGNIEFKNSGKEGFDLSVPTLMKDIYDDPDTLEEFMNELAEKHREIYNYRRYEGNLRILMAGFETPEFEINEKTKEEFIEEVNKYISEQKGKL